jgi:hypothetical protein
MKTQAISKVDNRGDERSTDSGLLQHSAAVELNGAIYLIAWVVCVAKIYLERWW